MADFALFIGWGSVRAGREEQAQRLFMKAFEHLSELKQQGQVESFEPILLEPHGGDLAGFWLVKGDADKLNHIRYEDETFQDQVLQATMLLEDVGLVMGQCGNRINSAMQRFEQAIRSLEPVGAGR